MPRRRQRRWKRPQTIYVSAYALIGIVLVVGIVTGIQKQRDDRRASARRDALLPTTLDFPTTTALPDAGPTEATAVTVTWQTGRPLRVFFVGDSITNGTAASAKGLGFASIVAAKLKAHGPTAVTTDAAGGVGVSHWKPNSIPHGSDLAIVELGTNDYYARGSYQTQVRNFHENYTRLLSSIYSASPDAQVICVSIWRPGGRADIVDAFDAAIQSACGGGVYVDVTDIFQVKANRSPVDDFHPNDAGHRAIADAILHAIKFS